MPADQVLRALYDALDERRRSRDLTWAAVTREINGAEAGPHPIATSTIAGLKDAVVAEGDGVLQMLIWLDRSPESFFTSVSDADAERYRLSRPARPRVLRWDCKAIHSALDAQRRQRELTWARVAQEIGGFTPGMLTRLATGSRVGFPGVMRMAGWLGQPAATLTRISER